MRPHYDRAVTLFGKNGLERIINGTDRILVLPQFRGVVETYEQKIWNLLMAQIHPGDVAVDVGAFVGLYTIALAKRVGPSGRVVSFEPDRENFMALKAHVELNSVSAWVELIQAAVAAQDGTVAFQAGGGSESHMSYVPLNGVQMVRCVCLDAMFADRQLNILKIDVEGYEEEVLHGAINPL